MNIRTIRRVKRLLQSKHITYGQVCRKANTSYSLVYQVVNGYRHSDRVIRAIEKLTGESIDGDVKR